MPQLGLAGLRRSATLDDAYLDTSTASLHLFPDSALTPPPFHQSRFRCYTLYSIYPLRPLAPTIGTLTAVHSKGSTYHSACGDIFQAMAYMSRPTAMFPPGASASSSRLPNQQSSITQQQSSILATRIASKRAELDNLRQLCDMSEALASQMQALQGKIGTLKDGTEGLSTTMTPDGVVLIIFPIDFSYCLCSCELG